MIAFFLSVYTFLSSAAGKLALYALLAVGVAAGAWFALHEHDQRLLAGQAASAAVATARVEAAQAKESAKAVVADAQEQIKRLTILTKVKTDIAHAPITQTCATSPAVLAALRSLQPHSGDKGGLPKGPAGTLGVFGPTSPPAATP